MASRLEEEAPNQIGNGREDQNKEETWQKRDREYLLVVVTFMATVAFQAGVSPPGGVWQQDDKNSRYVTIEGGDRKKKKKKKSYKYSSNVYSINNDE